MIIECPECGIKNQTDKTPQSDKSYRCGKCGALITFQQITANQDTLTEAPKEKSLPEKPRTIATDLKALKGKVQSAKRVLWKKGNISTTGKGISRRFLVIMAILVVVVIIVYFYLNYG